MIREYEICYKKFTNGQWSEEITEIFPSCANYTDTIVKRIHEMLLYNYKHYELISYKQLKNKG
jgi:hypothetical protein